MMETPREAARRLAHSAIRGAFKPEALYTYTDEKGEALYWRIRARLPDGSKWIRPMRRSGVVCELGEPEFPSGKPLYRLHELAARPGAPVWYVEGENCADALAKLGLLATTAGSTSSDERADFSPLAGRAVTIWPDHDAAGIGHAERVAVKLRALGCTVELLDARTLALPEGGDCVDWIKAHPNATAADLIETAQANGKAPRLDVLAALAIERARQAPQAASGVTLRAVTLAEFLAMEIPVPEPLLAPLFTRQSLSLVYSWRGVGKTWFALGCAYAVASGGKFLRWKAPTPRRVLYLDGEMPAVALQRRLASIAAGSEAEASPDFFRLVTPDLCSGLVPDLGSIEGQGAVDSLIKDAGADFIVVDNLSCWVRSGVENEAESWRVMAEWLLRHRSDGRAIVLVHHAGKGGAQRGTSKKEDILDVSLDLRRPPTYEPEQGAAFAVEFKKSRHLTGQDAESFEAALTIDENGAARWTMTALKQSTYDRVVELAGLGLSQKEIAEELEINKSNVSRHWRKAVETGQVIPKGRDP